MGADSDVAAADTPLDDQPSRGSFFSRLKLPLRSRTRNLADFHVRPDEPHRQYSAGDHVTGSVILSVIKPIRITHLTVALHGFVRVYKNANAAAQLGATNPAVVPSDAGKHFRYHGNGHASLFTDEQVLCGEGRLGTRRWEFKFDLIFPSDDLPSSIDFERGTISYMVTATITRPTSIAPTMSAERKISLVEKLDIGSMTPPRERRVTMHAMHRRTKRRKQAATASAALKGHGPTDSPDAASDRDSRVNENANEGLANLTDPGPLPTDGSQAPRSPNPSDVQSEISGDSAASNNSYSIRGGEASANSVTGSKVSGPGIEEREITATVELLRGGCLPGDLLPVRIRVAHNRRVKSLHGVIVTFYRQGRVDYAPPASLFTNLSEEDVRKLEREEYYPKSKTGLGGLSLSSAGSCSVFRKDLSQAVAPLIIDPVSMSADIAASVRVPEDVFPSIKGVPGGLISFKYHIEVVVDLGGRLAGQSQSNSQPGRVGSMPLTGAGPSSAEACLSRLANWNGTIVDTDHLRREKGVIAVTFEVVVGTTDSSRARGKSVLRPALNLQPPSTHAPEPEDSDYVWQEHDEIIGYDARDDRQYREQPSYFPPPDPQPSYYNYYQGREPQAPVYVPPPQRPDDRELSEKERIRQAEQRLLPSEPSAQGPGAEAGPSQPSGSSRTAGRSMGLGISRSAPAENAGEGPSAPTLADLSHLASQNPLDDKQEIERRRLLQDASAPPEVPDDYEGGGPSAPPMGAAGPSTSQEPSAPVLDENAAYGPRGEYAEVPGPSRGSSSPADDPLPKYER